MAPEEGASNPSSSSNVRPLAGLSLYAGIQLSSAQTDASKSSVASNAPSIDRNPASSGDSSLTAASCVEPARPTENKGDGTAKSAPSWSAALRFAPRRSASAGRSQGNRASRAHVASLVAPAFSSAPVEASQPEAGHSAPSPSVHRAAPQAAGKAPAQEPTASGSRLRTDVSASQPSEETVASRSSRHGVETTALSSFAPSIQAKFSVLPVVRPPELRLPQAEVDADRALAREAALARGEVRPPREDDFDEFEGDDDEDINGFRGTSAGAKAAKKKKSKRKRGRSPSTLVNWDADYDPRHPNDYQAWKEVVQLRRQALDRVMEERERSAPHGLLREPTDGSQFDGLSRRSTSGPSWGGPAQLPTESWHSHTAAAGPTPPTARHSSQPQSGEEAYQRRLAMSQQASSGEDAYQRRLAMSEAKGAQGQASGVQQPFAPAQYNSPAPVPQEPAATGNDTAGPVAPASSDQTDTRAGRDDRDVASRQTAAAAIAARLARAAPDSVTAPRSEDATHSQTGAEAAGFAERLMSQWGHQEGEGLGAEGNKGRAEALVMEKTHAQRKGTYERDEWGGTSITTSRQGPRGRYTSQDPRAAQDLARFGAPSEVVLLENMITSADEVDDALPQEISEECSRHGIVQRVAIQPPNRVFVVFTGPAGAWKCVRELDGRFFAGRTVRARYYERTSFERGDFWR
ncbi:unnamed protein product [Parajaminaea phylloscopi]